MTNFINTIEPSLLGGLALIAVLGVGAQWISWRLHIPAILLLLILGVLAGPVTGILDPVAMFGDLLSPIVSLSVGIILFEGGMTLRLFELRTIGSALRNLIIIGGLTTWILSAVLAMALLDMELSFALLLGAILIVTGPTVIGPILRHIRPTGQVGYVLKWEGILIDPVGATAALLVFEAIHAREQTEAFAGVVRGVIQTAVIGGGIGLIAGFFIAYTLRRYWIPDHLQNPVTLMTVIAAFTGANMMMDESGLLAATVMGIYLANQKDVHVAHILEFKENLRVLLISGLFIVLAARVELRGLTVLPLGTVFFVVTLILVVRPVSVALATLRSPLTWRERLFIAAMAPRGIVAAAVASVFALRFTADGEAYPQAESLVPITFATIMGTVGVYGLIAGPLARALGVAQPNPQGVLFMGAHEWAREFAKLLKDQGFSVVLADTNWHNIADARMDGLRTYFGNVMSEHAMEEMDLGGIGRFVALTPNDESNSLAGLHFMDLFGRSEVYQLPKEHESDHPRGKTTERIHGRLLFDKEITLSDLMDRYHEGWEFRKTNLTKEFGMEELKEHYGDCFLPLAVVRDSDRLLLFTAVEPPRPTAGDKLLSMVNEAEAKKSDDFKQP